MYKIEIIWILKIQFKYTLYTYESTALEFNQNKKFVNAEDLGTTFSVSGTKSAYY